MLTAHAVLYIIRANEASNVHSNDVGETGETAGEDPDSQLEQVDPFQDLDRDKLTSLGIELEGAALVSTTAELRAAVAPGKTIVLRSGNYDLGDEDDAVLGKTSGLTLVGLGTDAPILRRREPARAVLTLDGVSDVTLHHIRLQRDDTSVRATAPTLRVSHANNVRLLRAELGGPSERAFDLVDVTGFELRNVSAYGHHGGIANLVDATDVTFAKVDFWTRQHLATGFGLLRSKLELLECSIRRHDAFGAPCSISLQPPNASRPWIRTAALASSEPTRKSPW